MTLDRIPYGCAPAKAGVVVSVSDEDDGQWTTLRSDVGQWKIAGEAISLATAGPHLVALRTYRGVAVVDLSRAEVLVSFTVRPHECLLMAADRDVAIIHDYKSLVIVFAGGNITRLPLPHPPEPEPRVPRFKDDEKYPTRGWGYDDGTSALLTITPSSFVVTAGGRRLAIARASVAVGPPGHITLDTLTIAPPTEARSDHQERAGAGVSPGGLLEAREVPPGAGAPAPEVLDALSLWPLDPYPQPPDASAESYWDGDVPSSTSELGGAEAVDSLVRFAEAIGLQPSSLFWRYVDKRATARFFERSSADILRVEPSLEYPVRQGLPPRFLTDPCVFHILDPDDWHFFGIYDYPPTRAAGHAIVYFEPTDHTICWEAPSFDGWLASQLANMACEFVTQVDFIHPFRVLRMLGLPPAFLDADAEPKVPCEPKGAPPPWFEAAHPRRPYSVHPPDPAEPLLRGDAARARGDWLAAERAYVCALHAAGAGKDETAQTTIAARLAVAYAELGWPVHERRMRSC